jgi:L-aminopeptidase/D-esterase-like protein
VCEESWRSEFATTASEAAEEAILNSMITAETTIGRDGQVRKSLQEYIDAILAYGKKA